MGRGSIWGEGWVGRGDLNASGCGKERGDVSCHWRVLLFVTILHCYKEHDISGAMGGRARKTRIVGTSKIHARQ